MKVQQWGTYSVRDHLRERAFVADVLLFDKLVIPRPATEQELHAYGDKKPGKSHMDYWRGHHWDPDRQRELLDILAEYNLAIELPWAGKAQHDWEKMYNHPDANTWECGRSDLADSIQLQIEMAKSDQAYVATGGLIALYVANQMSSDVAKRLFSLAKTPGIPVEAVIAYGSYADFEEDQAGANIPPTDAVSPYAMFGWEFFVPEDSGKTDAQLLRAAAKLASGEEFCETRQDFHGWLKLMCEGNVDRHDAYEQMQKKLSEYTKIIRKSELATVAKYAAKVAKVVAPLAGLAGHIIGVGVGVAVGSLALAIEEKIPIPKIPAHLQSAAVLYDARKFFGKH